MRVQDEMTDRVLTVSPGIAAEDAWNGMRMGRIRHLVVTQANAIVGLLSARAGHRVLTMVIVTIVCSSALAAGQGTTAPSRGAIERGRAVFEQNCATCHGKRGKGDAPGASAMKPQPTDLTMLTRRYGAFPAGRVEATLKGTDQTRAHTPGMMAWKALFLADANGNETTADARVKDVIAFIESLQVK